MPSTIDQFCRGVEFHDPPTIQNDNPIGVENGVDAVRDGDDGPVAEDAAS